jgi:hypothetical protein
MVLTLLLGGAVHAVLAGVLYAIVAPSSPARSIAPVHDVAVEETVVVLRCRPDPVLKTTPSRMRTYDRLVRGTNRTYPPRVDRVRPTLTEDLECLVLDARR